jgi:hypothetical protein
MPTRYAFRLFAPYSIRDFQATPTCSAENITPNLKPELIPSNYSCAILLLRLYLL